MKSAHLENISIQFSEDSLIFLNICLGIIMFGIALGIETSDFKRLLGFPKSALAGVLSQFFFLPFLTFLLVLAIQPHPAIALGMILVAACPGGNISNFISSISGANVSLSVGLTGIATLLTPILTPVNFDLWAKLTPGTEALLKTFEISFVDILQTVLLLLVIPLILGMLCRANLPNITKVIEKPIRVISLIILLAFIGVALMKNFEAFKSYLGMVFVIVLIHNALAFLSGYLMGVVLKIPVIDRRSISIETGIQNSGLGLIIILTFFDGNGGMALVAAWWGIWHIIAGLTLSQIFKFRDKRALRPT